MFGGDLTKESAPDQLVQTAVDAWGRLDIIVNNAGYTIDAPPQDDRRAFQGCSTSTRSCRSASSRRRPAPARARQGRARAGRRGVPQGRQRLLGLRHDGQRGQANYAAGKAAVVGLTKTLAKEWGQFKINVNAVAFGYIETRLTASKDDSNTMEIDGETVQLGIPDQLRGMAAMLIPLGRPGTPQEAAGGVFFLCSPWSNYVHGQVLNITGGQFTGMTT